MKLLSNVTAVLGCIVVIVGVMELKIPIEVKLIALGLTFMLVADILKV